MKTIIAAREAEALQHEMQTLETQRNELDDRGLLLLETSAATDDELRQLVEAEADAVSKESLASAALASAAESKTAEIDVLQGQRLVVASAIEQSDVVVYNRCVLPTKASLWLSSNTASAGVATWIFLYPNST